jgi:hypothetical protein
MQAKQMAASLELLSPLLDGQGQPARGVVLSVTAALRCAGVATVAATVKKFEKQFSAPSSLKPSASAAFVELIANVFRSAGSAAASKDFGTIAKLLATIHDTPAEVVDEKLAAAFAAKKTGSAKASTVDASATANDLTSSSADKQRFDALISEISKYPKAELAAIADKYLGYQRTYKTKADVISAIRARQLQDALEASRERRLDKIAV